MENISSEWGEKKHTKEKLISIRLRGGNSKCKQNHKGGSHFFGIPFCDRYSQRGALLKIISHWPRGEK